MNSLSIIYALIARGSKIILTGYSDYTGNFQQICLNVLLQIKKQSKGVINYKDSKLLEFKHQIYYEDEHDLTYLCLTENVKKESAFSFLSDLKQKFLGKYPMKTIFNSFSFQLNEFSIEIKPMIRFYEANPDYTKIGLVDLNKENKPIHSNDISELLEEKNIMYLVAIKIPNNQKTVDDFNLPIKNIKKPKKKKGIIKLIGLISLISVVLAIILYDIIF